MTILGRLALLFVLVPLVELALLIQAGRWIGLWPTVGTVVFTGIVGATLARMEGIRTVAALRADLAQGRIPSQPIQDGMAILVGGAVLLTPGFLTDLVGFALLLPLSRRWIQKRVARSLRRRIEEGTIQVMASGRGFGGADTGDLDPADEIVRGSRSEPHETDEPYQTERSGADE